MSAAWSVGFKDSQERLRRYINDIFQASAIYGRWLMGAKRARNSIELPVSMVAIIKNALAHTGVDMNRAVKTIVVLSGLLAATTAYAGVREYIESFHHTYLVMRDGTRMQADIVKVHGHMMVMIPVEDLPDYLHQQVIKVMVHR